jgi:hypothetical protein
MYLKYCVVPLSLALVASSVQAYDACPAKAPPASTATGTTGRVYAPVYTTTTYQKAPASSGGSGSAATAVAAVALVGVVGYLVWKHEHDKSVPAVAAACAAAQPVPTDYILKPPADPNATMSIDGITYTPSPKQAAMQQAGTQQAMVQTPSPAQP